MSGNPQLIAHLDALLANRGRIPFSEYMETVLYHPEYGYYSRPDNPIGAEGDFFTAANVDPAMGQLLAKLLGQMADRIEGFRVVGDWRRDRPSRPPDPGNPSVPLFDRRAKRRDEEAATRNAQWLRRGVERDASRRGPWLRVLERVLRRPAGAPLYPEALRTA